MSAARLSFERSSPSKTLSVNGLLSTGITSYSLLSCRQIRARPSTSPNTCEAMVTGPPANQAMSSGVPLKSRSMS